MDFSDLLLALFCLLLLLTALPPLGSWRRARRRRRVLREWAPTPTLTDLRRVNDLRLAKKRAFENYGAE